MPKFLKYFLISFLVIIFALVIIPFFIPLNSYKPIIVNKVKEITGRDLLINGDMKLSFLPNPSVTIQDVKLSSLESGNEKFLVDIVGAKAVLALSSLIRGNIKISEIELQQPIINLEILGDGRKNWEMEFPKTGKIIDDTPPETQLAKKSFDLPFNIENIRIIKGALTYTENKEKKTFKDIDFTAKIAGVQGPIDFNLLLSAFDNKFEIVGNIPKLDHITPIVITAKAFEQKVTIDGNIDVDNSSFIGTIASKGNTKNLNLKELDADYELNATLAADTTKLLVKDAQLGIMNLAVTANAAYNIAQNSLKANIALNPGNLTLDLTSNNNSSVNIKLQSENLQPIFNAFKISAKLPPIMQQKFTLIANLNCVPKGFDVQNINFISGVSNVQGAVKLRTDNGKLAIPYDLKINNMESLLSALGVSSTPIGSVQISGETKKTNNIFHTNTKIVAFGTNISLTGDINLTGKKPNIVLNLQVPFLNLDKFSNAPSSRQNNANIGGQQMSKNSTPWPHSPLDLSFLNMIDANITAQITKFQSGSFILDSMQAKFNISNGKLNITSITSNVYGGSLNISGYVNGTQSQDLAIKASLKDAHLKNIAPQSGKIKVTEGRLNLQADLNSQGNSVYKYVSNLGGKVSLNASNGKISGFDLNKIVNAVKNIKNIQTIVGVLNSSFTGGSTSFNSLESNINIVNGIATIQKCHLDAAPALADATGQINLPGYIMDVNANVTIDNLPPFAAKLYGPLDSPQHKLDTQALQNYLVKNVLGSVIKDIKSGETKPENILKDVLGIRKNKASNSDQESDQAPVDNSSQDVPAKLLQKGLKKLFK